MQDTKFGVKVTKKNLIKGRGWHVGDILIFDKNEKVEPGDVVVIQEEKGREQLRIYQEDSKEKVIAVAISRLIDPKAMTKAERLKLETDFNAMHYKICG